MLKIKNSRLTKLVSVILVLSMLVGMMPAVVATSSPVPAGTVESLVSGATLADSNTVLYRNTTLNWSSADASTGKYTDGWWIGTKVTAPAEMTGVADFENVKFEKFNGSAWADTKSFWDYQSSDKTAPEAARYVNLWDMVNDQTFAEAILAGTVIRFQYRFDWNADGIFEQNVTVQVDPATVILKKGESTLYPSASKGKLEASAMTVNGNSTNVVTATQSENITLTYADGWAVSEKVVAPINKSAEAKYQYLNTSAWGQPVAIDGDVVLSVPVNESVLSAAAGKNLVHTWRFDWDGNGTYEQIVKVALDPSKITLKDATGNTVYPVLGAVTPLNGGVVSGNGDKVTVTVTEASVNWSVKNPADGKDTDGWWIGANVQAPAEYTQDELKKAVYDYTCGDVKKTGISFWANKESADTAASHNINIWMELDPAAVKGTSDITAAVSFDWNADGTKDQTVTIKAVPGDKIVLVKEAQDGFKFETANPSDALVGTTYTNKATGGNGTGAVTYSIVDGNNVADINTATGTLTFKAPGEVDVKATKAGDDNYASASAEYSITAVATADGFKFSKTFSESSVSFKYKSFTNKATGGTGTVTYAVTTGADCATVDANGKVTFIKAGSIVVTATDESGADPISYKLNITKSEQTAISVSAVSDFTFKPGPQNLLTVTGGESSGAYVYAIESGSEVAAIDAATGALTFVNKNGIVSVSVYKKGDDCYLDSAKVKVNINLKAEYSTPLKFETEYPADITFNDNGNKFVNNAVNGYGEGVLTYAVISGTEVADIDAATGELTIKAAGTVQVQATKAAEGGYEEQTVTYTLNVLHDDAEFTVDDINLVYGNPEHQIVINETLVGSGKYMYSVEGANDIGLNVDADGKITFVDSTAKVGSVIIKVIKEEDSQYNAAEAVFTVNVAYLETEAVPTVTGTKLNESGWYTGDVTINAPEGYTISYYNAVSTTDWAESVAYNVEGESTATVYLKNSDGHITDAIAVEGIKLDTQAPSAIILSYDVPVYEQIIDSLTFDLFNIDTVMLTIETTDATSGIEEIIYYFGEEEHRVAASEFDSDGKYSVALDSQFKNKVTVKAVDKAGWTVQKDDTYVIVDADSPELTVTYEYAADYNERTEGDKAVKYSNGDVTVNFSIDEDNFDLNTVGPNLTVNGAEEAASWVKNESTGNYDAVLTFTADGRYELSLTYTDRFGHEMEAYADTVIVIDKVAPVVEVTYEDKDFVEDKYYSKRTATIKVTEDNFDAAGFDVDVLAVDVDGNPVSTDIDYASYLGDMNNWNVEGNVYTATIEFSVDANYTVEFACHDLACNEAEKPEPAVFTVDKAAPVISAVSYREKESTLDLILEFLSFGYYYNSDIIATFTVTDATSGVGAKDTIEVTLKGEGEITDKKVSYDEKQGVATVELTIPAQAKGYLEAVASDKAGNRSNVYTYEEDSFIVDTVSPKVKVEYAGAEDVNGVYNFSEKIDFTVTITEHNFYAEDVKVFVDDVLTELTWTEGTPDTETDEVPYTANYVIEGNGSSHKVRIEYADRSGNAMEGEDGNLMDVYESPELVIDATAPVVSIVHPTEEELKNGKYYNNPVVLKIEEHFFDTSVLSADVEVTYPGGSTASIAIAPDFSSTDDPDINLATIGFNAEGSYKITNIKVTDAAGNVSEAIDDIELVIDGTAPAEPKIDYSEPVDDIIFNTLTFGFYKDTVDVTVTVSDEIAGIDYIELFYVKREGESDVNEDSLYFKKQFEGDELGQKNVAVQFKDIPAELAGNFKAVAYDMAGNSSELADDKVTVVDSIAPGVDIKFVGDISGNKNGIDYYAGNVSAVITVNEANFYEGIETDAEEIINKYDITVIRTDDNDAEYITNYVPRDIDPVAEDEDEAKAKLEWKHDGDVHTAEIVLAEDGDYVVYISGTDMSGNEFSGSSTKITKDTKAPQIEITYNEGKAEFNPNNVTATIKITEHNFFAEDFVIDILKALDVKGANVEGAVDSLKAQLAEDKWVRDGNVYTAVVEFTDDANYEFDFDYTDPAGHSLEDETKSEGKFTVDKTAPVVTLNYSQPVTEIILNTLTFGFYNDSAVVEVKVEDKTTDITKIEWYYTVESKVSKHNMLTTDPTVLNDFVKTAPGCAEAEFTINNNARGHVTVNAYDKANIKGTDNDPADIDTVVVDTGKTPDHDSDPHIFVKYPDTKWMYNANGDIVEKPDNSKPETTVVAEYFSESSIDVDVIISELNFFEGEEYTDNEVKKIAHNIAILVEKTDDFGKKTMIEYLPNGAAPKYSDANEYKNITWSHDEDNYVHTATIKYETGYDYVITVSAVDFSGNNNYFKESKQITVDNTAPEMSVAYGAPKANGDPANVTAVGADQTATITVNEHNFDVKKFANELNIEAIDVSGLTNVNVNDLKKHVATETNWKKGNSANEQYVTITFSAESNYSFGFTCTDLAGNTTAYKTKDGKDMAEFVVDRTAPVAKLITFNHTTTWVRYATLNRLTYGPYNADFYRGVAEVTLTATDDISKVTEFSYIYTKDANESSINLATIRGTKTDGITQNGNVFTTNFSIPYNSKDQLNGKVEFTATDAVKHVSAVNNGNGKNDRIVVDTISPKIEIVPGNTNTGNRNNTLYYDKPFTTTIKINEANFDRSGFTFNVNGANNASRLNWNKSLDVYTATYTLSEDGVYKMDASHTDKSDNTNSTSVAQTMIIDQKKPVVTLEGLAHESANNQENIGFTLTVTDDNIIADDIKVELTSVIKVLKDEADPSSYELKTTTVRLNPTSTKNGVFVYTSDDLIATDGYYKLTCEAVDLAKNTTTQISVKPDESIKENEDVIAVEEMNFSHNCEGSSFWVTTEHTMKGSNEKIVDQLDGSYVNDSVVISLYEFNVDTSSTTQKTVFMLNDGNETKEIELTADNHQENVPDEKGGGRWFKNIYTLDNSYFEKDGTYSVNIITYDRANNSSVNTTVDAGTINFTVDRTAPVVSTNVKNGQDFREDEHWVQFNIDDANLVPESVKVLLKTDGGDFVDTAFEDLGNNEYRFLLKDGVKFDFEITAKDHAGNPAKVCKIEDIVVSSNIFVLIYANPTYFAIAIGAAVLLVGAITTVVVVKKKKKASK